MKKIFFSLHFLFLLYCFYGQALTDDSGNNVSDLADKDAVVSDEPVNSIEKRLALVIGNSNYKGGLKLVNPANDANLMAVTLENLGFEVIKRIDASKQSMEDAIRDFSRKLPNYNVALFYYAGHGIQVEGLNYLIPTDAELQDKSDCKFEAISVNYVVEEFEKYPNNVNIVILDACRNNPFRSWARGGELGFKAIPPTSGTIISFATSEGSTASDGSGSNGLFTEQLVKQMYLKQTIESVFKKTRVEVELLSNGAQSPQEWSKLKGEFYFTGQDENNTEVIIQEESIPDNIHTDVVTRNNNTKNFYINTAFLFGKGMNSGLLAEYTTGEKVYLSGGGGFGFLASTGYNFGTHFGTSAEISYEKSIGNDPTGKLDSEYTRWLVQITPKFLLPISKRHELSLGAGLGLYFNNWIFMWASAEELPSIFYHPSLGYHVGAEYRYHVNNWFSLLLAAKYSGVTNHADNLLYYGTFLNANLLSEEFLNFSGNALDCYMGFSFYF
jgi:hypothetical protein